MVSTTINPRGNPTAPMFKKILIYIVTIVVALVIGGVVGNLCADIAVMSWLDYTPPFHLDTKELHLYITDITFGFQTKFNIAQVLLTIIGIFVAPKIYALTTKK